MKNLMNRYTLRNRFALLALGIISVILLGNIGYVLVRLSEGGNPTLIDAMYWTIVTLATLGSYPPGMIFTSTFGKILTIVVVLGGVLTIFIGLQIAVGPWIERTMKRALRKKKQPIPEENHVIVCGYSELGREVIRNLKTHEIQYVVVTDSEKKANELMKEKIPYIKGDSTKTKTLRRTNIENAISLVAVSDDSTNAFICLTAHKINPDIRIVSSLDEPRHERILKRAGASHVVSSKSITGAMVGAKTIGETLIEVEEGSEELLAGLKIEQLTVTEDSNLSNKTIKEADIGSETGTAIVGIWKEGNLQVSVSPSDKLNPGDIILALGDEEQIAKLRRYAS